MSAASFLMCAMAASCRAAGVSACGAGAASIPLPAAPAAVAIISTRANRSITMRKRPCSIDEQKLVALQQHLGQLLPRVQRRRRGRGVAGALLLRVPRLGLAVFRLVQGLDHRRPVE